MAEELHGLETIPEVSPGRLRPQEPGAAIIIRQRARSEGQRVGCDRASFPLSSVQDEKSRELRAPHDQDHDRSLAARNGRLALVRRVHVRICFGGSLELEETYPGRFKGRTLSGMLLRISAPVESLQIF